MCDEIILYDSLYGAHGRYDLSDPGASHGDLQKEDQERFYTVLFVLCAVCGSGGHDLPGYFLQYRRFHRGREHTGGGGRHADLLFCWLSLTKGFWLWQLASSAVVFLVQLL